MSETIKIKDPRYEHLRFNKKTGSLEGLYKLDVSKARGIGSHGYFDMIEEIIEAYTKLHPEEIKDALAYCREKREANYNDFGLNKEDTNSELRLGIGIPNGLLIKLMEFDQEFLNDPVKLTKFRKRFPGFNTAKKI